MAAESGVIVGDKIVPTDALDIYPTHKAFYGQGGLRSAADAVARLAITLPRQEAGMLVYQEDTGEYWKLNALPGSDPANWILVDLTPAPTSHRIIDADGDTYVDVERTADDDIVRIANGGVEWVNILTNGDGVLFRARDGVLADEVGATVTIGAGSGVLGDADGGNVILYGGGSSGSGVEGWVHVGSNVLAPTVTLDRDSLMVENHLEVDGRVFISGGETLNPSLAFKDHVDTGMFCRMVTDLLNLGAPATPSIIFAIENVEIFSIQDNKVVVNNAIWASSNTLELIGQGTLTGIGLKIGNYGTLTGGSILEAYAGYPGVDSLEFVIKHDGGCLIGEEANNTDWSDAFTVISSDDTGYSSAANTKYGLVVEADAVNTDGLDVYTISGFARTDGAMDACGVSGFAGVKSVDDTGDAIGVSGTSVSIRTLGAKNIGVYGAASGSGSFQDNYAFYGGAGAIRSSGRFLGRHGGNVSSTSDLVLGNGNCFYVRGINDIGRISIQSSVAGAPDWTAGSMITLVFQGGLTVSNGVAGTSTLKTIFLNGGADFTVGVGSSLTLAYTGDYWVEIGRKI